MRKSNKILLTIVGIVSLFLMCIVISLKLIVSGYIDKTGGGKIEVIDPQNRITKIYDLSDFDKIKINSSWKVDVKKGNDYKIKIDTYKEYEELIQVVQMDRSLKISAESNRMRDPMLYAEITMPDLKSIDVSGAVDLRVKNFVGTDLKIDVSGAGKIKGENCKYNSLDFDSSGTAKIDFRGVLVKDCTFDMSGAGKAIVTMNGGKLSGEISGLGKLEYYGKVSSKEVDISGLGKVEKMD